MSYVLLPAVIFTFIGLIAIVFIIVIGQIIKVRMSAVSKHSFGTLTTQLKEDNAVIMAELSAIKENLSAINKMMKEIE